MSEGSEADLYTLMVPVEVSQLMPDPSGGQGAMSLNYVLSERDYFDSDTLMNEESGRGGGTGRASSITLQGPDFTCERDDQLRISISCSSCSKVGGTMSLWYRCDPKAQENVNFTVYSGQAQDGKAFQFTKT